MSIQITVTLDDTDANRAALANLMGGVDISAGAKGPFVYDTGGKKPAETKKPAAKKPAAKKAEEPTVDEEPEVDAEALLAKIRAAAAKHGKAVIMPLVAKYASGLSEVAPADLPKLAADIEAVGEDESLG